MERQSHLKERLKVMRPTTFKEWDKQTLNMALNHIDDLEEVAQKLCDMLERSRSPEGLLGAVADTYPYVKAELLAKAKELIEDE